MERIGDGRQRDVDGGIQMDGQRAEADDGQGLPAIAGRRDVARRGRPRNLLPSPAYGGGVGGGGFLAAQDDRAPRAASASGSQWCISISRSIAMAVASSA